MVQVNECEARSVADDAARLALDPATMHIGDIVKQSAWTENPTNPSEYEHAVYGVIDPSAVIATERFAYYGTHTMVPAPNPSNSVPTISGGAFVGVMLTATHASWTDEPASYGSKWQTSAAPFATWTDIDGATGGTYTQVSGDTGNKLRYGETATNAVGTSEWVYSEQTVVVRAQTFPSGAVAYYRLDETLGTRVDATGNGYDLTDNNDTGYTTGVQGNAAAFGGGNTLTQENSIVSATGDFTVELYVKSFSSGDNFALYDGASGLVMNIQVDKIKFDNGAFSLGGTGGIAHDFTAWTQIIARLSGTTFEVFIDGVVQGTETISGRGMFVIPGFGIGGGFWYNLTGAIDEVGVWDRALTGDEITTLVNGETYPQ